MVQSLKELLREPDFAEDRCWRREHHAANRTIIRRAEQGDTVYLILSGSVKVLGETSLAGSPLQSRLEVLTQGEVFGEFCLVDCALRSATVATGDGCEVAAIDRRRLLEWCDAHPEFGYRMLKELFGVIARRLRASNERLLDLTASHLGGLRQSHTRP